MHADFGRVLSVYLRTGEAIAFDSSRLNGACDVASSISVTYTNKTTQQLGTKTNYGWICTVAQIEVTVRSNAAATRNRHFFGGISRRECGCQKSPQFSSIEQRVRTYTKSAISSNSTASSNSSVGSNTARFQR